MIDLSQIPSDRCTLTINDIDGERIRSAIISRTGMSWNQYLKSVGMAPQNVHNYLTGRIAISLVTLTKLLSGTDLCLNAQLQIHITESNGSNALDATSIPLEEMLSGIDSGYPIEDQ